MSKAVTKKEWETVYEESLKIVEAFPLAEKKKIEIDGIETICLVKTKESEIITWDNRKIICWCAVGDYEYMRTAEENSLPRDLGKEEGNAERYPDALFGLLPMYLDYQDEPRFDINYELFGCKTQGESYHMYLLAVACMIESRLGSKAFVYGDITRGQCVEAVRLANEVLDNPIEIPARCVPERLLARVNSLPVNENEKLRIYQKFYLGSQDAEFGRSIKNIFSDEICDDYWEKRFNMYTPGQIGFENVMHDYLLWGFELEKMCKFVKFVNDSEGPKYETFVNEIMDTKLYVEDKDCSDPLNIDQDESRPYSVYTYFAQFAFAGAKNKKIDRFIPLDEIRKVLTKAIGNKCDVNEIINCYIKENQDQKETLSDTFKDLMNSSRDNLQRDRETYAVTEMEDLLFYETGDKVLPEIIEALESSIKFYNSLLEETDYINLMKGSAEARCEFLARENRYLLIRDKDWEKIFTDIKNNEKSFARYYPMVRVIISSDGLSNMLKAIVLNDDLYKYCLGLIAEK